MLRFEKAIQGRDISCCTDFQGCERFQVPRDSGIYGPTFDRFLEATEKAKPALQHISTFYPDQVRSEQSGACVRTEFMSLMKSFFRT